MSIYCESWYDVQKKVYVIDKRRFKKLSEAVVYLVRDCYMSKTEAITYCQRLKELSEMRACLAPETGKA